MLLKIESFEEIGRFASFKHKAPQFGRLSLVYARNGYGKSTLCAILRSVAEQDAKHITARRRVGAVRESTVQTSWAAAGQTVFTNGTWNRLPRPIFIFDSDFVSRNVHLGESVTRENKRSLLPVVLGSDGVALAKRIVELDREARGLDAVLHENGNAIRMKHPVISTHDLDAFCNKEIPADIDDKIAKVLRAVERAKQAIAVKQTKLPRLIALDPVETYREVVARSVADVSEKAGAMVAATCEKHRLLPPHGERWLKYGIERTTGKTCPFCDQNISGNELVEAYRGYFSEALNSLTTARDKAIEQIDGARGSLLDQLVLENKALFEFWMPICDLGDNSELSSSDLATINVGLDALAGVFDQKVANPLAPLTFGSSSSDIDAAFALIGDYNARISHCASTIQAAKDDAASADFQKADELHKRWLALKGKAGAVKPSVDGYLAARRRKEEIEAAKRTAQTQLKAVAAASIGARQAEINRLLLDFGANFKVVNARANFVGRDPNTDYEIEIGGFAVKVGERSETDPSFKTILSAGDKTTLALAFFLAQIRGDPELAEAVVIFDDPFSSQDLHRQFETTSQIRAVATVAKQTLVLSHDPRFLELIERDANAGTTAAFQMLCSSDGEGTLSPWSAEEETKALYVKSAAQIREYAHRSNFLNGVTPISLVQSIRPFLEDYLRHRFPGRFHDMAHLPDMTKAIADSGASDPMFASVTDLTAINEYTRPEMHGGATVPDPDELRTQAQRVVRVIGSY